MPACATVEAAGGAGTWVPDPLRLAPSAGTTALVERVSRRGHHHLETAVSDDLPELIRDWPPAVDHLGPCPSWCQGRPHESTSDAPCDQYHVSGIMDALNVDTVRGD